MKFQHATIKRQGFTGEAGGAGDSGCGGIGSGGGLSTYVPTVFQDLSNPLLSQLAIFAKSLEYMNTHDKLQDENK